MTLRVIEEGRRARKSFRLREPHNCLQLQSYSTFLGVVADSFLTGSIQFALLMEGKPPLPLDINYANPTSTETSVTSCFVRMQEGTAVN